MGVPRAIGEAVVRRRVSVVVIAERSIRVERQRAVVGARNQFSYQRIAVCVGVVRKNSVGPAKQRCCNSARCDIDQVIDGNRRCVDGLVADRDRHSRRTACAMNVARFVDEAVRSSPDR